MIIFIREWKRNLKALIIWTISIGLFVFLIMSVYQSFADSQSNLQELLKNYPEGFLAAFGIDRMDISNVLGFYGMEGYLMITLFGGIYAMLLSSNILAKEENEKTIEYLLAKPVTRTNILNSKIGLTIFNLFLFNILNSIATFIAFEMYKMDDYDKGTFLLLMVGPFLLHLTFASIGLLMSVFVTKAKTIYSTSIGFVLVTYFISVLANLSDKLEFFKYFSPFKYVDAADIVTTGSLNVTYLLIMTFIIIIGISLTYVLYTKKDITV